MGNQVFSIDQQSVILKGIASQILQMSKPTFEHLSKLLQEFEIQKQVSGEYQYTSDEINRALLMCAIITNGIGKKEGVTFGERCVEILHYALNHKNAHEAVVAMSVPENF